MKRSEAVWKDKAEAERGEKRGRSEHRSPGVISTWQGVHGRNSKVTCRLVSAQILHGDQRQQETIWEKKCMENGGSVKCKCEKESLWWGGNKRNGVCCCRIWGWPQLRERDTTEAEGGQLIEKGREKNKAHFWMSHLLWSRWLHLFNSSQPIPSCLACVFFVWSQPSWRASMGLQVCWWSPSSGTVPSASVFWCMFLFFGTPWFRFPPASWIKCQRNNK